MTSRVPVQSPASASAAATRLGPACRRLRDPGRRRRWSKALQWYGGASADAGFDPAGARADNFVFALGAGVDEISRALAEQLGRQSVQGDSVKELGQWAQGVAPESVLVVGQRGLFSYMALAELSAALASTRWGLVTGVDTPAIEFFASKVIAANRFSRRFHDGLIDPEAGRFALQGPSNRSARNAGSVLSRELRSLIVVAHGDGSHANLDSHVLCGLIRDTERDAAGHRLMGCSSDAGCKKIRQGSARWVRMVDVRCHVAVLLSCNSLSVAAEMYPSDNSLVLAALDGFAAACIATPRQASFPEPLVDAFVEGIAAEDVSLGDLVRRLNSAQPVPGTFILMGDPLWRLPAAAIPEAQQGPARMNSVAPLPNESLRPPTSRTYAELRIRLSSAAAIERGTAAVMGPRVAQEPVLRRALIDLARARRRIEDLLWARILRSHSEPVRIDPPEADDVGDPILPLMSDWDQMFGQVAADYLLDETAPGALVGDKLRLLHLYHAAGASAPGNACSRCGTTTIVRRYSAHGLGLVRRLSTECPLCGPQWEVTAAMPIST